VELGSILILISNNLKTDASTHIMTKTLPNIIFYLLTISSAVGQTSFYDRLADSAIVLTRDRKTNLAKSK
jgi:hypothetical protein